MKKHDFVEYIAGQITQEFRDEFPFTMDYDDNTWAWLERGRKFARMCWPTFNFLQTNQTKTPNKNKSGVRDEIK